MWVADEARKMTNFEPILCHKSSLNQNYFLRRFSHTRTLKFKSCFHNIIALFTIVNHNYYHKQRTFQHRNTQNGSKSTNHKSKTMTFGTRLSNVLLSKRSAKMIGSSKKHKRQLAFQFRDHVFLKNAVNGNRPILPSFEWCVLRLKHYV